MSHSRHVRLQINQQDPIAQLVALIMSSARNAESLTVQLFREGAASDAASPHAITPTILWPSRLSAAFPACAATWERLRDSDARCGVARADVLPCTDREILAEYGINLSDRPWLVPHVPAFDRPKLETWMRNHCAERGITFPKLSRKNFPLRTGDMFVEFIPATEPTTGGVTLTGTASDHEDRNELFVRFVPELGNYLVYTRLGSTVTLTTKADEEDAFFPLRLEAHARKAHPELPPLVLDKVEFSSPPLVPSFEIHPIEQQDPLHLKVAVSEAARYTYAPVIAHTICGLMARFAPHLCLATGRSDWLR